MFILIVVDQYVGDQPAYSRAIVEILDIMQCISDLLAELDLASFIHALGYPKVACRIANDERLISILEAALARWQ
jgi:hypothetical protein